MRVVTEGRHLIEGNCNSFLLWPQSPLFDCEHKQQMLTLLPEKPRKALKVYANTANTDTSKEAGARAFDVLAGPFSKQQWMPIGLNSIKSALISASPQCL